MFLIFSVPRNAKWEIKYQKRRKASLNQTFPQRLKCSTVLFTGPAMIYIEYESFKRKMLFIWPRIIQLFEIQ